MSVIRQNDFIESIREAFERINLKCSQDYLGAVRLALTEVNSKQKRTLKRFYTKLERTANGETLLADDPGIAVVFLRIGQDVRWEGFTGSIEQAVAEAVDRAWQKIVDEFFPLAQEKEKGTLRRKTPPVFVHWRLTPGEQVEVTVSARGDEIDGRTYLVMMQPDENLSDIVVNQINMLQKNFSDPVVLGVGVGGTPEAAMYCASLSLNDPLNMKELLDRGPQTAVENVRVEMYNRLNAQAEDEKTFVPRTVFLDVKVRYSPVSVAVKPVCIMLETGVLRRVKFVMDGTGPVFF